MKLRAAIVLMLALVAAGCAGNEQVVKPDAGLLLEVERKADSAYESGDNESAARSYRTLVESMPNEATYWYRLANTLVRIGNYNDAASAYRRTLVLEPKNARAWHNLGIVRLRQAQQSFAQGVENSRAGDQVFDESLRLSSAVFSLAGGGGEGAPAPELPNPESPLAESTSTPPDADNR